MHIPHMNESITTSSKPLLTELTSVLLQLQMDGLYVDLYLFEVTFAVGTLAVVCFVLSHVREVRAEA